MATPVPLNFGGPGHGCALARLQARPAVADRPERQRDADQSRITLALTGSVADAQDREVTESYQQQFHGARR